jgi:transcription elongation factor Elf1
MAKKLQSLSEFNQEVSDFWTRSNTYPKPNGIACPNCGEELFDTNSSVLTSNPLQKNIHCGKCGYRGYRNA